MKKSRRKIIRFKLPPQGILDQTEQAIAQKFMHMQRRLMPIIKGKNLEAGDAIMLIAAMTHAEIHGATETHSMSETDMLVSIGLLMGMWEKGLFIPSADFPFSLEQAKKELEEGENK